MRIDYAGFVALVRAEVRNTYKKNLLSEGDVEAVLRSAASVIKDKTKNGLVVSFFKLGAFKAVSVPARKCRNPHTGEVVNVPAKKKLKFSPSKSTKDALNKEAQ